MEVQQGGEGGGGVKVRYAEMLPVLPFSSSATYSSSSADLLLTGSSPPPVRSRPSRNPGLGPAPLAGFGGAEAAFRRASVCSLSVGDRRDVMHANDLGSADISQHRPPTPPAANRRPPFGEIVSEQNAAK